MTRILDELQSRLEAARSARASIPLTELEDLYTSGCAQVLELEAQALRAGGREEVGPRIEQLRGELRHVRTAIEWMREEAAEAATG